MGRVHRHEPEAARGLLRNHEYGFGDRRRAQPQCHSACREQRAQARRAAAQVPAVRTQRRASLSHGRSERSIARRERNLRPPRHAEPRRPGDARRQNRAPRHRNVPDARSRISCRAQSRCFAGAVPVCMCRCSRCPRRSQSSGSRAARPTWASSTRPPRIRVSIRKI